MVRVAVAGASGYMGAELLRLLSVHPKVTLTGVTSDRLAGEPVGKAYPHLRGLSDLRFHDLDPEWLAGVADVVFLALPHMESQKAVPVLRGHGGRVIDLSADYRLHDADDYVALFAVTCGRGVRERAQALKEQGAYLKSHALQALAIECAEAFAEMLHARLRTLWGFPDPPELTIEDKLKARYRGLRVSFGYPACPELADQAALWRLLRPEQIGIQLTEGFMMDPEASVSAVVFHHPAAKYFKAE